MLRVQGEIVENDEVVVDSVPVRGNEATRETGEPTGDGTCVPPLPSSPV